MNTGASVTFVDKLELSPDLEFHGAEPPAFGPEQVASPTVHAKGGAIPLTLPAVFERGDGESYRLNGAFAAAREIEAPEDFARILRDLEGVTFTVGWTYRRAKLMRPAIRETVAQVTCGDAAVGDLRRSAISYWRGYPHFEHLADIAEGKENGNAK